MPGAHVVADCAQRACAGAAQPAEAGDSDPVTAGRHDRFLLPNALGGVREVATEMALVVDHGPGHVCAHACHHARDRPRGIAGPGEEIPDPRGYGRHRRVIDWIRARRDIRASRPAGGRQQTATSISSSAPRSVPIRISASGQCRRNAGTRNPMSSALLSRAMQGGRGRDSVAMGSPQAVKGGAPARKRAILVCLPWQAADRVPATLGLRLSQRPLPVSTRPHPAGDRHGGSATKK